MDQTKGNYTDAAKLLGVHPNYHRLIRNLNLKEHLKRWRVQQMADNFTQEQFTALKHEVSS